MNNEQIISTNNEQISTPNEDIELSDEQLNEFAGGGAARLIMFDYAKKLRRSRSYRSLSSYYGKGPSY